MSQQPIGLKEFIDRVRGELLEEHSASNPIFMIGQIELEISFVVERNLNGGIDLQVVQAKADKKNTEVQTVKVRLDPLVTIDDVRASLAPEQKKKALNVVRRTFDE